MWEKSIIGQTDSGLCEKSSLVGKAYKIKLSISALVKVSPGFKGIYLKGHKSQEAAGIYSNMV